MRLDSADRNASRSAADGGYLPQRRIEAGQIAAADDAGCVIGVERFQEDEFAIFGLKPSGINEMNSLEGGGKIISIAKPDETIVAVDRGSVGGKYRDIARLIDRRHRVAFDAKGKAPIDQFVGYEGVAVGNVNGVVEVGGLDG